MRTDCWGIQMGLLEGNPILLGKDGLTTMHPGQAMGFLTDASAAEHAKEVPGSICTINLNVLEDEYSFYGEEE